MNIAKLELTNFKSFNGKYEIIFHNGLNVITGENGCGKSNILDAINCVLGNKICETEFINKHKKSASLKLTLDNCTTVMLNMLKKPVGKFQNMYFIDYKYTDKEQVFDLSKKLNLEIIDNFGSNLDYTKLEKSVNDIKIASEDKQYIVVSLQKFVIDNANNVINIEELKQCQIV